MEKINIAELLKDCPKGMELDCTNYNGIVTFEKIIDCAYYPIEIGINYGGEHFQHTLTKYGESGNTPYNKCIIFPKGKTTWEGFVPPCKFKDGDIVTCGNLSSFYWTCILKETPEKIMDNYFISDYCSLDSDGEFLPYDSAADNVTWIRLATEEEKQKLFDAIKKNGYKWDAKTKTLEKLVEPKFKDGDIVYSSNNRFSYISIYQSDRENNSFHYHASMLLSAIAISKPRSVRINDNTYKSNLRFATEEEERMLFCTLEAYGYIWNYETKTLEKLIEPKFNVDECDFPDKFDITTLKPFDKVLCRMNNDDIWGISLFERYVPTNPYPFFCIQDNFSQCIPYNDDTKHLLGTTNDCDDFYKTWEE